MGGRAGHRRLFWPLLVLVGVIGSCGYGVIAALSSDPAWFLGWASVPDPERIVIRVADEETVLAPGSAEYNLLVAAVRDALSGFSNAAPLSAGVGADELRGDVLELYFAEPVDFHLPFDDGRPTALLIPVEGRHAEGGYVFRGRDGDWWSGQMCMRDPQPVFDALVALGYLQQ